MNYKKHYNLLIDRARNRQFDGYKEKHHIIPKCIGGTDVKENLVYLTPEEHYLAHQLLVKMYPENDALVYAANKMTVTSITLHRSNKRYGWLKRKYQAICKKRIGNKNPSYGRRWYYHPETFEAGKFLDSGVPEGWVKGRIVDRENFQYSLCECCNKKIKSKNKFCSANCRNIVNKRIKEEKSKKRAYETWNEYVSGNFKSPLEFLKHSKSYKSHQHMYRDWKKYVEEYKVGGPDGKGMDCNSIAL